MLDGGLKTTSLVCRDIMDNESVNIWIILPQWLAAVGTISAVIVALYLARRDRLVKCRVKITISVIFDSLTNNYQKFLSIYITNTGFRPFLLTGITWQKGIVKKFYYDWIPALNNYSSNIPIKLEDGEQAKFFISYESFENKLYPLLKVKTKIFSYFFTRFTKIIIHTSLKSKTYRLTPDFRKELLPK